MHYGLTGLPSRLSSVCHISSSSCETLSSAHALWAIKQLNFNLNKAGDLRKLQISELDEMWNEACGNARIIKSMTKIFHDRSIHRKNFVSGQKVLLYNSRLHLFARELKSWWSGPFMVHTVFPHGAVRTSNLKNGQIFKVNRQRLKPFLTTKLESDLNK